MRPLTDRTPKPVVEVSGKPFLWHLINNLTRQGIDEIVVLCGYKAEVIQAQLRDFDHNAPVKLVAGNADWTVAERIMSAEGIFKDEYFLLYGDNYASVSLSSVLDLHHRLSATVTLTVAEKSRGNVQKLPDNSNLITYSESRSDSFGHVDIGFMAVDKKKLMEDLRRSGSLSKSLAELSKMGAVGGFEHPLPYYSISDLRRLEETRAVFAKNRILLLDRDGVINEKPDPGEYVTSYEQMRFIPENLQALRQLCAKGYSCVIISNQAAVARGQLTKAQLQAIHEEMLNEFQNSGVKIEALFVCTHHWDDKCNCRKPAPGMFYQAARRLGFLLDRTMYVGDDIRDYQAATRAGCSFFGVGERSVEDFVSSGVAHGTTMLEAIPAINDFYKSI